MSDILRLLFHNRGAFHKALTELRRGGGPKQKAADQVSKIVGDFAVGGETLAKLTNYGESRIPHCVKYDLQGDCRLVTVQNDGVIWLVYVGDHMVVGTLSEVKGFEFSLIIILGCDRKSLPDSSVPEDEQWRDALRFYVAMTRGRDQVVLIYSGDPSPFLKQMEPYLGWQKNDYSYSGKRAKDVAPLSDAATLGKPKVLPVVLPPKIIPQVPWPACLSASAQLCLRKYFGRTVYRTPRQFLSPEQSAKHLTHAFEQWLKPINVNGLKVSQLFRGESIRSDLVREIQTELAKHGCGLVLDQA